MIKKAPKILAVSLLVVIAVLLLVINSSNLGNIFGVAQPPTQGGENNQSGENGSQGDQNEPNLPVIFANYPKQATLDAHFSFLQQIEVDGFITLNAVVNALSAAYIVVTSNSSGGDFNVHETTVSVIKLSDCGTLQKISHLQTQNEPRFLAASLTSFGIQVTVADSAFTYLNMFCAELNLTSLQTLPPANAAKIFPQQDSYLLLTQNSQNMLYLVTDSEIKHNLAIEAGEILEIFELNESFLVFLNQQNSYRAVFLRDNLTRVSTVTINSGTLLAIRPASENGASVFLAAESRPSGVFLVKYSPSYIALNSISLGFATSATAFAVNANELLLLLNTPTGNAIYLADATPRIVTATAGVLQNVTEIYRANAHQNGFYLLATQHSALAFLEMRHDGNTVETFIANTAKNATFVMRPNGNIIVLYETENKVEIVGL